MLCSRSKKVYQTNLTRLEWAAGPKNNEDWADKNAPGFGQPTFQALAAQETLILYKRWKQGRPQRLCPSEASGWSDYCEEKRKAAEAHGDDSLWGNFIANKKNDKRSHNILSVYRKMEEEQEEEDTEMLIRLVKIRQNLWT